MANKYTKTPSPPKEKLEDLYYNKVMTQVEIGELFGVSQRIVFRWFRDLDIKSRIAAKRNQRGKNNHMWMGKNVSYSAAHSRVVSYRGNPKKCEVCKTSDPDKTYDWANMTGEYWNVYDYKRMCRSCHWKHDGILKNLGDQACVPPQQKQICPR